MDNHPNRSARVAPTLYKTCEALLWGVGLLLLGYSLLSVTGRSYAADQDVAQFLASAQSHQQSNTAALALAQTDNGTTLPSGSDNTEPTANNAMALPDELDTSLWSKTRIEEYHQVKDDGDTAIAVLEIDKLNISAPVYVGANDHNLNRGISWLDKTAPLDGNGNAALAGHRDSFFRGLKDVAVGDKIKVTTLKGPREYTVSQLQIVDPSHVEVLAPTKHTQITLITCYPFYFVGSAPQRFIVTATEDSLAQQH
ncbi:class D sortase [Gilvimarinus agarilyticus]|uniref:class D sortase n=1 Tax=Gilvimarinus agarilyticus TaxID=679259 RepID=UPI0006964A52|nr:class D sortase [Gilvimarinus agarilyticus]